MTKKIECLWEKHILNYQQKNNFHIALNLTFDGLVVLLKCINRLYNFFLIII